MTLEHKEIIFRINNMAYTVDIGYDLDNEVEGGLKNFLNLAENISTQELLLAYLRKTQELIYFKKDIENQVEDLINFEQTRMK
jgi:hypothetical protein